MRNLRLRYALKENSNSRERKVAFRTTIKPNKNICTPFTVDSLIYTAYDNSNLSQDKSAETFNVAPVSDNFNKEFDDDVVESTFDLSVSSVNQIPITKNFNKVTENDITVKCFDLQNNAIGQNSLLDENYMENEFPVVKSVELPVNQKSLLSKASLVNSSSPGIKRKLLNMSIASSPKLIKKDVVPKSPKSVKKTALTGDMLLMLQLKLKEMGKKTKINLEEATQILEKTFETRRSYIKSSTQLFTYLMEEFCYLLLPKLVSCFWCIFKFI